MQFIAMRAERRISTDGNILLHIPHGPASLSLFPKRKKDRIKQRKAKKHASTHGTVYSLQSRGAAAL